MHKLMNCNSICYPDRFTLLVHTSECTFLTLLKLSYCTCTRVIPSHITSLRDITCVQDSSRKDGSRKLTEDLPNTISGSLKPISLGEQFHFHSCDTIKSGKNPPSLCLEVLLKRVLDIPQQSQVGFRPLKQHKGILGCLNS